MAAPSSEKRQTRRQARERRRRGRKKRRRKKTFATRRGATDVGRIRHRKQDLAIGITVPRRRHGLSSQFIWRTPLRALFFRDILARFRYPLGISYLSGRFDKRRDVRAIGPLVFSFEFKSALGFFPSRFLSI